jgi:hypothetical protein
MNKVFKNPLLPLANRLTVIAPNRVYDLKWIPALQAASIFLQYINVLPKIAFRVFIFSLLTKVAGLVIV